MSTMCMKSMKIISIFYLPYLGNSLKKGPDHALCLYIFCHYFKGEKHTAIIYKALLD